jgi:hypothetical protein
MQHFPKIAPEGPTKERATENIPVENKANSFPALITAFTRAIYLSLS